MGASPSTPFEDITKEEVSEAVANLGDRYEGYCETFVGNGIDGSFLGLLDSEKMVQETLDDLGITNRLHRRVLVIELQKTRAEKDSLGKQTHLDNDYPQETSPYIEDYIMPMMSEEKPSRRIEFVSMVHCFQAVDQDDDADRELWRRRMVDELSYQSQLRKQLLKRQQMLESQIAKCGS
jgi:hypothetical protein